MPPPPHQRRTCGEAPYRQLLDTTPALICTFAPDSTLTYVNRAYCEFFQTSERELVGKPFLDLLPDEASRRKARAHFSSLTPERPEITYEHKVVAPDGAHRWQRWTDRAVWSAGGELLYYLAVGEDITDRREAEEGLRARSRELAERVKELKLLMRASDLLARPDLSTRDAIADIAARIPEAWRYPEVAAARIAVEGVETAQTEEFRDTPWMQTAAITSRGRAVGRVEVCYTEERPPAAEGPFLAEERALVDELAVRIGERVERRALEEKLRNTETLELIGQLAGGVAHDFNNHLMVMQATLRLLEDDPDRPAHFSEPLRELASATRGAADLTRQLLSFSQNQPLHPRPAPLNATVSDALAIVGRVLPDDVEVKTAYDPSEPVAHADPSQLERALTNLILNARDAMPGGGTLRVATRTVALDEAAAKSPEARPGRFVLFEVADTGEGLAPTARDKLFQPFFTTKPESGTGLGLASAYGIVKQHAGWIEVESEVGSGSVFRVYIPASEPASASERETRRTGEAEGAAPRAESAAKGAAEAGAPSARAAESAAAEPRAPAQPQAPGSASQSEAGGVQGRGARPARGEAAAAGGRTVLIAEDDPAVQRMLERIVRRRGHRALAASSGPEALALWDAHPSPIDVLLTDMVMPGGMSGRDLADALLEKNPDLGVVVLSGYSADAAVGAWLSARGIDFLEKPCDPSAIERAIAEALPG